LVFTLLYQKIVQSIAFRLNGRILSDFVSKLFRLPITFYEKKTTGEIIQRVDDHYRIEKFLTGNAVNALMSVCLFVFYSAILINYSALFFILNIAFTTGYFFWTKTFLKRRKVLSNQQFTYHSKNDSHLIEVVQGMTEIKFNGGAKQKLHTWQANLNNIFSIQKGFLKIRQVEQAGSFVLGDLKSLLLTFIAAWFVINNKISVGQFMAIQLIIGQLSNPVDQFMYLIQDWQDAIMSFDRMEEIKAIPDEDAINAEPKSLIYVNENISINDLSFCYSGSDVLALDSINLKIEQNKLTAIVGSSGSGKSTLLKLLMKFYEPTAGSIQVGENNLSAFTHKDWRAACGSVMQDGFIFSDSIAQNIALDADTPDPQKLSIACSIAEMNDFLKDLPLGHETMLVEGGLNLSKGQRQRLLIARVIYKNPSIIFFDEATNSLDTRTEAAITENLQPFLKNKTVITVAHRLDTVINADNIIVLEKGSIVEQGTHKELIANHSTYYNLVKNQLQIGE
jgi:ATP-binding cassette subfamily B protein